MSTVTVCYRFFVANCLSLITAVYALLLIFIKIVKNPFKNPWAVKLNLVPPACLTDPKYGVHKYVKANSIKVHYVESGDPSKPLMLFVHGFPEFWYSWRHQITHFKKDYRCVAFDMRGYGDSEKPERVSDYKIELLVEDIMDLIRQLGYKKCIIVAHDWGGLVACKLRETHPEVLQALVLLSSSSMNAWTRLIWTTSEQMTKSLYFFMNRIPMIPELLIKMNDLEAFDKIFPKTGDIATDEQDMECNKYWFRKQMALTPPINYYRANFGYTWQEKVHEENIPFLSAHGEKEKYLSRSILDIMKMEYSNIETVILEGCGHFMLQEEPDKVNKLIRDFLQNHNL